MMSTAPTPVRPTRWRSCLITWAYLGLAMVIGGIASLTAMALVGPRPTTIEGWHLLVDLMRAIFFPVFFAGVIIVVVAGTMLFLRQPRVWLATTWFRIKLILMIVALPSLHFFARGRVLAFYESIEAGDLAVIDGHWDRVGMAFAIGFTVLTGIAWWGRHRHQ